MRTTLLATFLLFFFMPAFSQRPGDIDSTYGYNGFSSDAPLEMEPGQMAVQPDGKIVLLGFVRHPERYLDAAVARYTATGAIDKTFSQDGIVVEQDINVGIFEAAVTTQPDGKVIVAGVYRSPDEGAIAVVRYTHTSRRDATFGGDGLITWPYDISNIPTSLNPQVVVQRDGKIVVAFTSAAGSIQVFVLNANGSFIQSLSFSRPATEEAAPALSAYPDGGFVLSYTNSDGTGNNRKATVYSSRFGEKTIALATAPAGYIGYTVHTILPGGKIAIGTDDGANGHLMVQLTAAGQVDVSFGNRGYKTIPGLALQRMATDPSGKIILQGSYYGVGPALLRLNTNGSLDATFGNGGVVASGFDGPITVYGNRLYIQGSSDLGDNRSGERVAAYLLSTAPRFVKVNLYGNTDPYANREWNNWNNLKDRHFNNFYYSDSTFSNISVVMSNRNGVNDNGPDYGSTSPMAPGGVLRHSSYSIGPRTLTFSGLAPSKYYSFELYASRNGQSGNSTVFSIGSSSRTISTYQNLTRKAVFTNVKSDAQGKLVLTLKSTKDYNYLNGFVLKEAFNTGATSSSAFNNEVVHAAEEKVMADAMTVQFFPNPSSGYFTVRLKGRGLAQLRVTDANGRLVELKRAVAANSLVTFGQQYKPGSYMVEVMQGTERKTIKLVKIN